MSVSHDKSFEREEADANRAFHVFWQSREWRPIADYDRDKGEVALFRWPKPVETLDFMTIDWCIGYHGEAPSWHFEQPHEETLGQEPGLKAFRHAQDCLEGMVLDHQPTEFALITASGDIDAEDWRTRLLMD